MESLENILVERLCKKNGWEYGSADYDLAIQDVKWFLSQPEILSLGEKQGIEKAVDIVRDWETIPTREFNRKYEVRLIPIDNMEDETLVEIIERHLNVGKPS